MERPVIEEGSVGPQRRGALLEHEHDSVLVYPNEGSLVWGIERLLFDLDLGRTIARRGHEKLLQRFGENVVAEQIAGLMQVASA